MKYKYLVWAVILLVRHAHAQINAISTIQQYSINSNKIFEFQEINVDWNMSGEIQLHLNDGLNNLREQNLIAAEVELSQVVILNPKVWPAYYYRSICYKITQQMDRARNDLLLLVKQSPPQWEYYVELGKISHFLGELKEALKYYEGALKLKPKNALVHFLMGNTLMELSKLEQSTKHFNTCLDIDPNFYDAEIKLGIIQIINSQKVEACLPYLDQVIIKDSLNRSALLIRSIIKSEKGEGDINDLNKLVRINPQDVLAKFMRAVLLTKQERYDLAFSDMQKVFLATYQDENFFQGQQTLIDKRLDLQFAGEYTRKNIYGLNEVNADKVRKAFCLLAIGEFNQALSTLREVKNWHENSLCLFLVALTYEHAGNHNEALNFYDQALKIDDDIIDAHKKRGVYKTELRRWSQATFDFSEILRINPNNYVAYKLRGICHYHQKNFDFALDDFSAYLKSDSLNIEVLNNRGMTFLVLGDTVKAIFDFAKARNFSMLDENNLLYFANQVISKQDTLAAIRFLETVNKTLPNFSEGHMLRLKLLTAKKDWVNLPSALEATHNSLQHRVWTKESVSFLAFVRGLILANVRSYNQALAAFNEAILNNDQDGKIFIYRGLVFLELKRQKEAISDFKKADKLGHSLAKKFLTEFDSKN